MSMLKFAFVKVCIVFSLISFAKVKFWHGVINPDLFIPNFERKYRHKATNAKSESTEDT